MRFSGSVKKTKSGKISKFKIALLILIALAIIFAIVSTFVFRKASSIEISKLSSPIDSIYKAFGDKILYYDDQSIICLSDKGIRRWTYDIGSGAGFDCSDSHVVIWHGSNIYVLDKDGKSTYSDNLGTNIAFAHIDKSFLGIVLGDDKSSRLNIRDLKGKFIDEESDAFLNTLILDFGFFGKDGEYLWTLKLDTDSTAANSILNTFEVGKMNTGEISLGNYICYKVLFENGNLRIINTRKMWSYDYRVSKETMNSTLVYGWKFLDFDIAKSGEASILFAPMEQLQNMKNISDLRLIYKNNDKRYTLPTDCVGALVNNNNIYAVATNTVYKASAQNPTFSSYPLELANGALSLVAKLNNGKIIISDGFELFVITLP